MENLFEIILVLFVSVWTYDVISGHGAHSSGHRSHTNVGDKPTNFHDDSVVQDKDHIGEHLEGIANLNVSEMSPSELEFHYFKLHDFDNNSMLDGLEIFQALTHLLPYEELDLPKVDPKGRSHKEVEEERRNQETNYYIEIVDSVLEEDDLNNDGYLTYTEYLIARHRVEYEQQRHEEDKNVHKVKTET